MEENSRRDDFESYCRHRMSRLYLFSKHEELTLGAAASLRKPRVFIIAKRIGGEVGGE